MRLESNGFGREDDEGDFDKDHNDEKHALKNFIRQLSGHRNFLWFTSMNLIQVQQHWSFSLMPIGYRADLCSQEPSAVLHILKFRDSDLREVSVVARDLFLPNHDGMTMPSRPGVIVCKFPAHSRSDSSVPFGIRIQDYRLTTTPHKLDDAKTKYNAAIHNAQRDTACTFRCEYLFKFKPDRTETTVCYQQARLTC